MRLPFDWQPHLSELNKFQKLIQNEENHYFEMQYCKSASFNLPIAY